MIFTYTELKQSRARVLAFTERYVHEPINLRSAIADDLSLWELDGYTYLEEFEKEFNIMLPQRTYDFLCPDTLKMSFLGKIFYPFMFILVLPYFAILYLFHDEAFESYDQRKQNNKTRLTIGDLVATVATGAFVKREEIQIELKQSL